VTKRGASLADHNFAAERPVGEQHVRHVWRLLHAGEIALIKSRKRRLIEHAAVADWLASKRGAAT
jgi:excisionase family DNA binding protein